MRTIHNACTANQLTSISKSGMSPLMCTKGLRNRALDLSPPTPDFHAKFAPASIP
uniref:Uncharacterized protein n=1 Tax=Moniliophthora roreri TaxID=221103 RepID=A0A0W0G5X0_MONRR